MTIHDVLATGFFWHSLAVVAVIAFWCGHSFGSISKTVNAAASALGESP